MSRLCSMVFLTVIIRWVKCRVRDNFRIDKFLKAFMVEFFSHARDEGLIDLLLIKKLKIFLFLS